MNFNAENSPRYLWIKGPANLTVESGTIEINGAEFTSGEKVLIHASRSYIMKLFPNSNISLVGGYLSQVDGAGREEVETYEEWKKKAQEILDSCTTRKCRIAIVGEADSGKTSFAAMLGNSFLKKGEIAALLDADPGQNTIGLPGFLAIGNYSWKSIWPREIGWEKLFFLGRLSPAGLESEVILGAMKLARSLGDSHIIIDTDGWFSGIRAEIYKYRMVNSLTPDFCVMVGEKDEKHATFEKLVRGETELVKLRSPPRRAVRNKEERKLIKGDKFISLLNSSLTRTIDLNSTPLISWYSSPFSATSGEKNTSDENQVISPELFSEADLKGRVCALVSPDGWAGGAGVVDGVRGKKELLVKTDYTGEIKSVQIGYIKLENNRLFELLPRGVAVGTRTKTGAGLYKDKRKV
ncbi:MAG: Clp1/GlmU family protein [Fervidicoccaceae archaeon]